MASLPHPKIPSGPARLVQLEAEPLSEARWSKIEQNVFARIDRGDPAPSLEASELERVPVTRAALLWGGAALAAACAVFAGSWLFGDADPALSRISTGASASHVTLPGVVLDVSPDSAVVVSGNTDESQLVVVDRGEVACDVAHRRPGAPFFVQAGEVRVEVVGTRFRVTREGEAARVSVQEGVVKVSSRGRTVRVAAGQSWPERVEVAPAAPSAATEARATPAPEDDASPVAPSPRAPRNRAGDARSAEREPAEKSSLQADFEAAAQLEAKQPARAIQLYRGLEAGSSSWARNALFAHGRLEAARGNKAEARRILSQYMSRFPRGPNAQDARMLLERLE